MKRIYSIILSLCFLFLIVSCEKNVDEIVEHKIPIDSLYFSCKINGELITLNSPSVTSGSGGAFFIRLYKLQNNPKDSAIIGYYKSFQDDHFRVTLGFNKSVLVDSTYHIWSSNVHNYKEQIYAIGSYIYQYTNPVGGFVSTSTSLQNEGFYVEIFNKEKGIFYTSYPESITDYSKSKYDEFESTASCRITKSMPLNSGIYSDYRNAWFIEADFDCKLYGHNEETINSISLTEGQFKGVF